VWNRKQLYGVRSKQSIKGFSMKALCLAAVLAAASAFGLSPASAAPGGGAALAQSTSPIILAQYHGHSGRSYRGHSHYVPGRRYRSAPHGWHRYSRRPGNWRTRGCILVGPIWFCP
jgi:hypothetical protein